MAEEQKQVDAIPRSFNVVFTKHPADRLFPFPMFYARGSWYGAGCSDLLYVGKICLNWITQEIGTCPSCTDNTSIWSKHFDRVGGILGYSDKDMVTRALR